ncbi:MAG: N-acetylmuramoyl-L-alanine amidase, partial [Sneathiella sp.]
IAQSGMKVGGRSHRFAGFRVLKAPDVPSVLVELGYLSNRQDEKILKSSKGQTKLAASIAKAVDKYFKSVKP